MTKDNKEIKLEGEEFFLGKDSPIQYLKKFNRALTKEELDEEYKRISRLEAEGKI